MSSLIRRVGACFIFKPVCEAANIWKVLKRKKLPHDCGTATNSEYEWIKALLLFVTAFGTIRSFLFGRAGACAVFLAALAVLFAALAVLFTALAVLFTALAVLFTALAVLFTAFTSGFLFLLLWVILIQGNLNRAVLACGICVYTDSSYKKGKCNKREYFFHLDLFNRY